MSFGLNPDALLPSVAFLGCDTRHTEMLGHEECQLTLEIRQVKTILSYAYLHVPVLTGGSQKQKPLKGDLSEASHLTSEVSAAVLRLETLTTIM